MRLTPTEQFVWDPSNLSDPPPCRWREPGFPVEVLIKEWARTGPCHEVSETG